MIYGRKIFLTTFIALICWLNTPKISFASTYAKADIKLNLRELPTTESKILEILKKGQKIETLGSEGGWTKIQADGKTGYVKSEFIHAVPAGELDTSSPGFAKTNTNLNLRTGPTTESDKIILIKKGRKIETLGEIDGWSKVKFSDYEGYVKSEFIYAVSEDEPDTAYTGVELTPWAQAKNIFAIGQDAEVYDIYTGETYYVRSFSNGSHADVEPVTANDTAIMKSTYGGVWKWDPRPVLVLINGHTMAASINGMPHGGGVNSGNNMDGQVCIHFKGSSAHNGNYSFTNWHQEALMDAYNMTSSW
ncbi:MAG: SH3 domain-containing protein [Clostridiales bacterium]|nr:SH3 domain-containing protein [Clostridiales bacterium]